MIKEFYQTRFLLLHMQKELVFLNFKSFILTSLLWSLKNTAAIHCPKKKYYSLVIILQLTFFLMNWTWISHFTYGNKSTSHPNGIHTHTPNDRAVVNSLQGRPVGSQTSTSPRRPSMVDVRTNWQNAQMTLSTHQRPATADRGRNQWAKAPK